MFDKLRWKRYAAITLAVVAVLGAGASLLFWSLRSVPSFYRSIELLSLAERVSESRQFLRQSTAIFNQMENESVWSGVFRDQQVNAWLAGDFARKHSELLPAGVTDPRVSFDNGRITLGFQMANAFGGAVISASGRVWLPEPNYVAVEFEHVQAGSLPVPARVIVETISTAAKSAGIAVDWREHSGHPVALVRLSERADANGMQVDRIELRAGLLYLSGRSPRESSHQAAELVSGSPPEMSLNRQAPASSLQR